MARSGADPVAGAENSVRRVESGKGVAPVAFNPGAVPDLRWIAIADLVIDDRYQRELAVRSWRNINAIAANFRWSQFSTVLVAPVEGGSYAIVDGQHRCHAAQLCGIETVPCQVVQMDGCEQAAAFAAVNGNTVKVTPWVVYRAAVMAGEPWAIAARDAVAAAGARLMTSNKSAHTKLPGEVFCAGWIVGVVKSGRGDLLTWALDALVRSESGQSDLSMWGVSFLRPWVEALGDRPRLREQKRDLVEFLDTFDFYDAIDRIDAARRGMLRDTGKAAPRHDLLRADIGSALDAHWVQVLRVAS